MPIHGPGALARRALQTLIVTVATSLVATVVVLGALPTPEAAAQIYDAPAIRQIMRDAKPSDYRWSSVMLGIVRSVPFQMRRALP